MVKSDRFFNRDISWLSFNERVLQEATKPSVPLMERFRFLSIYSSNLDEFYRVRVPVYNRKKATAEESVIYTQLSAIIDGQQKFYGQIIREELIPELAKHGIIFLYNTPVPGMLEGRMRDYFYNHIAGYIQIINLELNADFFPLNNQLYKAIFTQENDNLSAWIINIPSDVLPRFLEIVADNKVYILFLDDIVEYCLQFIFKRELIVAAFNIKLTRDASLDLIEKEAVDPADLIEKELSKRDKGKATRFLYDSEVSGPLIERLRKYLDLKKTAVVAGGRYHNLKDLGSIPLKDKNLQYPKRPALRPLSLDINGSIFTAIVQQERLIHTPYHSYDCILRFFNEASIDREVTDIFVTLYRIASDSQIAHALISAAKNGKNVFVIVELKARFDEANNIRWAKSMKAAGIKIVYTENELKIHAKIALIKRKGELPYIGLLSTGNFNENTSKFYTDHILLTSHQPMLHEMEMLFEKLLHVNKIKQSGNLLLNHLLIAQFNLYEDFIFLIDREIAHAATGHSSGIILKLNNLEEESLISKLYEASNAGVNIQLIIRGICRLIPGVPDQSERISVRRIVDRYLEHGRVFIFENLGNKAIYLGSSDWMNRNIFHRIEVCFPIYDETLKNEIIDLINLQLADNVQAAIIDSELSNRPVNTGYPAIRSQEEIYNYLSERIPHT